MTGADSLRPGRWAALAEAWRLPRPSDPALATAAAMGAALLWGTSFVAAKGALDAFPPITLALLRFVVALAILEPLVRWRAERPAAGRQTMLLGLTGVALPLTCQNVGLLAGNAASATLLYNGATPILASLLAAVALRERLLGWPRLGLVASTLGVVCVVRAGSTDVGFALRGDVLFLLGSASVAVYLVAMRRAFAGGSRLATLAGMSRWGVIFLLPMAGVELAVVGLDAPDPRSILLLLYLGAGCSALAYSLSAFGARHLEAGRLSILQNIEVPIGVGAGVVLLREPLAAGQVVGAVLIISGAALALARTRPIQPTVMPRPATVFGGG